MSSVLFLATAWNTSQGGINALNRDLVSHCGMRCKGKYTISCVVLSATSTEIEEAQELGVNLFSLDQVGLVEFSQESIPQIANIFRGTPFHPRFVVGHDIFTGTIALVLATALKAKSVVFIHTDYSSFKALQDGGRAVSADEKEDVQRTMVRTAHYVMGIGPRLTEYARDLDETGDTARIRSFVPGLPSIPHRRSPKKFAGITFGRYDERNQLVKQHQLCVEAFLKFASDNAHDSTEKTLTVIGLSSEKTEHARQLQAILGIMEEYGIATNVSCREFMPREETWEKLRSSSLCLMLSWREGFGLAGWEAIAAGVPVLMSRASGLFCFLDKFYDPYNGCFYSVDVRGTPTGKANAADVEEACAQIRKLYACRDRLRRRSSVFLRALKENFTWSKRARVFLKRLDPDAFDFSHRLEATEEIPQASDVENSIDLEV